MKLTIAQIQDLMTRAGWPDNLLVTGAAVFYFESNRGDPHANKVDNIERSYGLAQINLGLPGTRLNAERAAWGPAERLYDPLYNLQLAWQLYQQQGWDAWRNTYRLGRYTAFLPASQVAYSGSGDGQQLADDSGGFDFFGIPDYLGQTDAAPTGNSADDGSLLTQQGMFSGPVGLIAIAVVGVFLFSWITSR